MRLTELAARLGATLPRGRDADIRGVAAASLATESELVFAESEDAFASAVAGRAGAILTTEALSQREQARPVLAVAHPRLAFARAARLFKESDRSANSSIHPSAIASTAATLAEGIAIGPLAVIGDRAVIGARTCIDAGGIVGEGVTIGDDCHLYPRVVVYPGTVLGDRVVVHSGAVLGADGFGYVRDGKTGEYLQFPQQGRLIIEDDVEIGANTTIDRGALEETRIGRGTKIDNLVHVGHNVTIGRNVVIAAQTGVSGSSTIGDGAIVGGQVGIADHVQVGPGAILGAQAGIPTGKRIHGPGTVFWGTPARPIKDYLKELATLSRLTRTKRT